MSARSPSFFRLLLGQLPTVCVLAVLAGIGLLGNHFNWKLPRSAVSWGRTEPPKDDWCEEHSVPESSCTICHPDIAVKPVKIETAASLAHVIQDPEHAARDPLKCQIHTLKVQFASMESVEKAGVKTQLAAERPMAETVDAYAEIEFDPGRVAKLASRASGLLWRVEKSLGQSVRKGDAVCLLESAEAGKTRLELLEAIAALELKSKALERLRQSEDFRSQNELIEAQAAHRAAAIRIESARQTLLNLGLAFRSQDLEGLDPVKLSERIRFLGLAPEILDSLDRESGPSNLLPVISPIDGTVVAREISLGESVTPDRVLYTVADLTHMTAVLSVSPTAAERLAPGQKVFFYPEGATGEGVGGRLSWISATVDDSTRTLRAFADVDNSAGRLRAHAFGTARVTVRSEPNATAVPEAAIHWEGCCHIAFIRTSALVFQVRKVRLGAIERGHAEILEGIAAGEAVAVEGSHVLKSEILRSGLGAGCCVDEKKP